MCKGSKVIISREHLLQAVVRAIEEDDLSVIIDVHSIFAQDSSVPYIIPGFSFDDPIVSIHGIELNALAFCFRAGYLDIARYLIEKAGCSLAALYDTFRSIGKSPVHILCEYGHLQLLMYFLPIHVRNQPGGGLSFSEIKDVSEEISAFQDPSEKQTFKALHTPRLSSNTQSPIQRACEFGHLSILTFLYKYFQGRTPHPDFDVHSTDEKSGENCALISARNGNFPLMEFLYTECKADFHCRSRRKESALQLVVLGFKHHKSMDCVTFLVEEVKVDIAYEYEETLLLCEDPELQVYLEAKLDEAGIKASKDQVEEVYAIRKVCGVPMSRTFLELEERVRRAGEKFEIKELFRSELDEGEVISSITPQSVTPFSMFSRNLTPELLAASVVRE